MRADFHLHSTVSDGSRTVGEMIALAKEKKLDAISITDHDTLAHLAQIPENPGLQVISGIEISAIHQSTGTKAHILGYHLKNLQLITTLTQPLLEARAENSQRQVEVLKANGFLIDEEKLARADGKYLYKQHIMDYLVATGQATELFGEFYQSTFKHGGICDFDIEYIDVFEAVKTIKMAGGLAVLAHPGQQQNFWLIPDLVAVGLNGLELNHRLNSREDKAKLRKIAAKHGLFLTGGSDDHGKYEAGSVEIGDQLSDESGVFALCHR